MRPWATITPSRRAKQGVDSADSVPSRFSYYGAWAFFALTCLMGGSARADIQSLILLRPIAAIVAVATLFLVKREQLLRLRFAYAMLAACILSVILQLIPLPFHVWSDLAGREMEAKAVVAAGIGHPMQPISLTPIATWNALYSLLVPLAMLGLVACMEPRCRSRLLPTFLIFGFVSGLLGVLQAVNPSNDLLYFYRITNRGAAVGLYANRNHQAALLALMIPLLTVFASSERFGFNARVRMMLAVSASIILVPLLLVTGSRAGLFLVMLGFASTALLYRPAGNPLGTLPKRIRRMVLAAVAGVILLFVGLAAAIATLPRAEAIRRLFAQQDDSDLRVMLWKNSWPLVRQYAPWGSGQGSFPDVYAIVEPTSELNSSYANHAHNDWLEVLLTGGLPAMLILGVAILGACYAIKRLFIDRRPVTGDVLMGRLGLVLIAMLAAASAVDYPLRTPSMAALFVVALVWTCDAIVDMGRTRKGLD